MNWQERPVEWFCSAVTSGGTPSTKRDDFYGGDIPWVRTQEVAFQPIWDTEVKITEAGLNGSAAKWIPENSVIVAMYGASAGRIAVNRIPLTTNQACCNLIVDPDRADYRYIYYALSHRSASLEGLAKGAAQRNLNAGQIRAFEIPAPSLAEQQQIAEILSAYDDLIENNRRRMELLEEAARQLYREWFVRLRFPGHEHARIVDGVPEGWKSIPISDLCSFLGRGISPKYDEEGEFLVINQKCVRNRLLSLDPARRQSKEYKPERALQYLDVVINSTGTGTLGRVAQCWITPEKTTVDSHVTLARPMPNVYPLWFGYSLMELQPLFEDMGEGATNQKELSKGRIGAVEILFPPSSLRAGFSDFAAGVARQVTLLSEQNARLRAARDLLLPRLMSGEISV